MRESSKDQRLQYLKSSLGRCRCDDLCRKDDSHGISLLLFLSTLPLFPLFLFSSFLLLFITVPLQALEVHVRSAYDRVLYRHSALSILFSTAFPRSSSYSALLSSPSPLSLIGFSVIYWCYGWSIKRTSMFGNHFSWTSNNLVLSLSLPLPLLLLRSSSLISLIYFIIRKALAMGHVNKIFLVQHHGTTLQETKYEGLAGDGGRHTNFWM